MLNIGNVYVTRGAANLLERTQTSALSLLARHVAGDWGDLDDFDKKQNQLAVEYGNRVLSAYTVGDEKIWIITEADRSATTMLLPEEY